MKVCILCNGLSEERGVSINSAKTIYEILENNRNVHTINIIFIDENRDFYLLKKEFLFANTMEDFIHFYTKNDYIKDYINYLKSFHKIFLTTHGTFGEDGDLQHILESQNIAYIGPSAYTARNTFLKLNTLQKLWDNKICESWDSEIFINEKQVENLLHKHRTLCIKPNDGGSSIGVKICSTSEEAMNHIGLLQSRNYVPLIEEVHSDGIEFSINLVNGTPGDPTEIITNGVFSYKKKYFPSNLVCYKHPASFPKTIVNKIKEHSVKIYKLFQCSYFLRIDGFYIRKSKNIRYTDVNTIPGFQLSGLFFKNKCHFEVVDELLHLPESKSKSKKKKKVYVIFGGDSSEQNVSIITSCNVVFNLKKEGRYEVKNFLLYKRKFWPINYKECFQTSMVDFQYIIKDKQPITIKNFLKEAQKNQAVVFNGLHGGIGENGTLQKMFEQHNVSYTGSNSKISKLCMDKHKTMEFIKKNLGNEKHLFFPKEIFLKNFASCTQDELTAIWLSKAQDGKMFIKPNDDGCSVGSKLLQSLEDLLQYHRAVYNKLEYLGSLPLSLTSRDYILQEYIATDSISSKKNEIIVNNKTNWFEGSVGTIGGKVLSPSVSVAAGHFLTMEEKFLQGTGTNLTPIPPIIASVADIKVIKKIIKKIITILNINSYCRIDYFYNPKRKKFILIEINTLPALTPATVIFQQAIQEGITPRLFLKKILQLATKSNKLL